MKSPNKKKTRNVYISIVILALVVILGGWLYLSTQKTTLEVVTDKDAYFFIDEPQVKMLLENSKNADAGEVVMLFDDSLLGLSESKLTEGVSMREVENSLIFDLSNEYFDLNNPEIANLTFEIIGREISMLEFDKTRSNLTAAGQTVEIRNFVDKEIEVGQVPDREETGETRESDEPLQFF